MGWHKPSKIPSLAVHSATLGSVQKSSPSSSCRQWFTNHQAFTLLASPHFSQWDVSHLLANAQAMPASACDVGGKIWRKMGNESYGTCRKHESPERKPTWRITSASALARRWSDQQLIIKVMSASDWTASSALALARFRWSPVEACNHRGLTPLWLGAITSHFGSQ